MQLECALIYSGLSLRWATSIENYSKMVVAHVGYDPTEVNGFAPPMLPDPILPKNWDWVQGHMSTFFMSYTELKYRLMW